jgi:hypothetical protein
VKTSAQKECNQMYELKLKNRSKKSKSINPAFSADSQAAGKRKVRKFVAKLVMIKPYSYVLCDLCEKPWLPLRLKKPFR